MKYIEVPSDYYLSELPRPSIFLANGIVDCPDWQKKMVDRLSDCSCTLLNPRRENFPIEDPNAAWEQIAWERQALHKADAVSFWFPKDTLCPIVLYELGCHSEREVPIFVGTEYGYAREIDVEIQTTLARPEVCVVHRLNDLITQVKIFIEKNSVSR